MICDLSKKGAAVVQFEQRNRGRETQFVSFLYIRCTQELSEMDEELAYEHLRLGTSHEADDSAVDEEKLNNRSKLNAYEGHGVELVSAVLSLLHVVQGNYGVSQLSRAVLCPYDCSHIKNCYRCEVSK